MAREKLSVEERRRRNRDYQRKRREKLNSDPEKKYAMQVEDRQRWKRRVQDKKVIQIDKMGDRAQRNLRKYWREAQKRSRQKRSCEGAVQEADTPPDSPQDQDILEYNARESRRQERERKERSKT
ncbi:Dynein heavy chain-like protein [Dissostichus eleginoides]|uniref:Dynein heavy chain-like protein n=1 Tax=Dissostichus eleginoides TaxID=100907 RepID=A0AAD9EQX8_DISEL|nr:Dynein heavy chain-like protein [Dissostichus eleginoides]